MFFMPRDRDALLAQMDAWELERSTANRLDRWRARVAEARGDPLTRLLAKRLEKEADGVNSSVPSSRAS